MLVFVVVVLVKDKLKVAVLLLASYLFYAYANVYHLLILLTITLATYLCGLHLSRRRSRLFLGFAIGFNLSFLLVFKYLGFSLSLASNAGIVGGDSWLRLDILLPIGISFYTFQAISYLVDIYRRNTEATHSYSTFSLYLAFFPQVLAGPIERSGHLTPQLAKLTKPHVRNVYLGLKIALWGYFCKLIIADKLAVVVQSVLANYPSQSGLSIILALYMYSFQIYFDFYGYTNIAIGIAKIFGVDLSINFNHPYLAASIKDFWRRWHITLMTWFRDYLYLPLGGRSKIYVRYIFNILAVFLISGLWHGAAINFLLWGLLHAIFYLWGVKTLSLRRRFYETVGILKMHSVHRVLRVMFTFSLVSFAWLFFVVEDLGALSHILKSLVGFESVNARYLLNPVYLRSDTLFFIGILFLFFTIDSMGYIDAVISKIPSTKLEIAKELAVMNVMIVLIVLVGDLGSKAFIYFRF